LLEGSSAAEVGQAGTVEGYFTMRGGEFTEAGSSATSIKSALARLGYPQEDGRRAAVSAFEAEMNVIIHAVAGTLHYVLEGDELRITVTDIGPGIPDVEQAMQEGFTTAPEWAREKGWGSGLGLPNIKRNCDSLEIETMPGEGTTLRITVRMKGARRPG
jgi:anti-sigma regulatory factor (Ser/Thr protein kinase)